MPPGSPAGNRSFGLSGAGKGAAERSFLWRRNLDEVDFHREQPDGFSRKGVRLVKKYPSVPVRSGSSYTAGAEGGFGV